MLGTDSDLRCESSLFRHDPDGSFLLEFDSFSVRFGAASKFDGSFGNIEMFCEEFNESDVRLAVVRFGAKIDGERIVAGCDDFLLTGAGFDGDLVGGHDIVIITFLRRILYNSIMKKIVEVRNFRMDFGNKTVIRDLSFEVERGEIFGLLGANGSGKTTTLRALLGLYKPTSGELLIDGKKYDSEDTSVTVGYLPEERGLYRKETVIDTMMYFGELKGLKNPREWSLKYLERVGLSDKANEKIEKLSGGQQQKVQLGVTIMGDPKLLILDEPTKGFDPMNRRLLMEIIEELHKKGCAIILITHYMDEVEKLCDRALLLKDGVARAYGTIREIRKEFGGKTLDEIFVKVYGGENE